MLTYCRYNLMDRSASRQLIPVAERRGTAVVNASILHMGMLSQRGPQDWHPAPASVRAAAGRAKAACEARGVSISDVATQFAIANESVTVTLVGSSKIETVKSTLAAASQPLDPEEVDAVEEAIGLENLNIAWPSGRPEHWEPGAEGC